MPDKAAIELSAVAKRYDMPDSGAPQWVLRDLDLEVKAREAVAVIGPSGSGKSTLLNIIGTLDRLDRGSVRLSGRDVTTLSDTALAAFRIREIGFVFQLHHLLPQLTALENVLLPTLPRSTGIDSRAANDRGRELLDRVGLGDRLHHRPGRLSGGECQRVAVVRALINRPGIILADEPTGSLDRRTAEDLSELLVRLNDEDGTTLVVVTHSAALATHMKRTLRLVDGKLEPVAA